MALSKVYFTDFHASFEEKPATEARTAGPYRGNGILPFRNRYTAVKIHFGEPGNLAYLRPNYARVLVDMVKRQGGKVFLPTATRFMLAAGKRLGSSRCRL